jgi:TP901 family phage tail tape measure protein
MASATLTARLVGDAKGMVDAFLDGEKAGDSLQKKFATVGRGLAQTGAGLTAAITVPLTGIGVAGTKMATDLDTTMSQIVGLVGIPREEVAGFRKEILAMGPAIGKSAQELGEALYFVASAGIASSEAMGVVRIAAQASASGLGKTSVIADALSSAMNAYGSANLSAAAAADILTAAVKFGKLEADALAPVLGRLLPTSSAMGIGFEQVAGSLAVMSRTGLGAEEAATSLSAVLSTLLKPSAGATKTLSGVGLAMGDLREMAQGEGGLVKVMRTLAEAFGDNDEALATVIPNVRAFRGIMNVLAQDSAAVDEVMRGVADAAGTLDTAFAAASETGGFKMQQAMQQINTLLIQVGDVILPLVARALAFITPKVQALAEWWGNLSPQVQTFIVTIGALAAAAGPLLLVLGGILLALSVISAPILLVVAGLVLLGAAIAAVVIWWDEIKAAVGRFAEFFLVTMGPAGWVILALWKFRHAFVEAFEWVRDHVGVVIDAIVSKVSAVVGVIRNALDMLAQFAAFGGGALSAVGGFFGGGRAAGGPVSSGRTYLVGERGPELLTMGGSGYVTPNSASGIGNTISIVINALDPRSAADAVVQTLTHLERTGRISMVTVP